MTSMRVLLVAVLTTAAIAGWFALPDILFWRPPQCEMRRESQTASPDGTTFAVTGIRICADGGFVTYVDRIVELSRIGESPETVLVMPDLEQADTKLNWPSADRLVITPGMPGRISFRRREWFGIMVTLNLIPSDKAERKIWLLQHGVPRTKWDLYDL